MAKLGTDKRPIRFHVQTEERLREIAALCDKNGWIFVGGLEPDKPEDLCEVEYLLNPQAFTFQPRMGNSDYMTIVRKIRRSAETSRALVAAAKSIRNAACNEDHGQTGRGGENGNKVLQPAASPPRSLAAGELGRLRLARMLVMTHKRRGDVCDGENDHGRRNRRDPR